jgi:tetratricopeptide (TPR) repeat protein
VFVNCCHLGAAAPSALLDFSRPEFAASVAQALIKIGVRCVVAAGWAVDDAVAEAFAETFYERLLSGNRFMDAVARAREEAHSMGGNTWAAYQCYGDPNWTLELAVDDAQRPPPAPGPEFAGVTSPLALVLALSTIATMCKSWMPKPNFEEQRTKIRYLQSMHAATWGGMGEVAEAFANAWTQVGDRPAAIEWYRKALEARDGGASMKAIEQLENLRVRVAAEKIEAARKAADPAALQAKAREAAEEVRDALRKLEKLSQELPSQERADLCGSAHKRLAMILDACGDADAEAIEAARRHYADAEELGSKSGDAFYPALNVVALEVAARARGVPAERFKAVREAIAARLRDDPDFWSAVGDIELSLYEALNDDALAPKLAALREALDDLRARWPAQWMWASVRDQARFVLPRYARRASADEKAAGARLLEQLEAASVEPAAPPARPAAATPVTEARVKPATRVTPKKAPGGRNARRGRARRS